MTTRPNNEQEYSSKVRQMACDIITINKNMNNNYAKPVLKFMSCCSIGTWGCAVDDCFIQEFLRGAKEDIQRLIEAAFAAGREKDAPKQGAKGGIAAVADGFRAGLDCAGLATRSCSGGEI